MIALLPGRLELSRESGEALTRQLTNQLRALITGGRLSPGQSLPSSRTLARSLHVSRNTVSFAIEQLTAEGYLSTSQGRRPVVVAGRRSYRAKRRRGALKIAALRVWYRDGLAIFITRIGRQSTARARAPFSQDSLTSASSRTTLGVDACGARPRALCYAQTVLTTIRHCKRRCCSTLPSIAASRQCLTRSSSCLRHRPESR